MGDKKDNGYLLPSEVYIFLKWLGLIALPAIAVFVSAVGPAWGWPSTEAAVLTLNSLGVLIGALVGVSQASSSNGSKSTKEDGNNGR